MLEDGKITEDGSYEELMQKDGLGTVEIHGTDGNIREVRPISYVTNWRFYLRTIEIATRMIESGNVA